MCINRFKLAIAFMAVGAIGLFGGACTPDQLATVNAAIPVGVTPVTVQAVEVTAATLQAAGVPDATIAAAQAKAAQVQRYAVAACGAVPTVTTIAGLFLASKPSFATAKQIAATACAAITGRPTYASLHNRRGEVVRTVVEVNGWPVKVEMTRVR